MFAEGADPMHDVKDQHLQQRRQWHGRRSASPAPGLLCHCAVSAPLHKGSSKPVDLGFRTAKTSVLVSLLVKNGESIQVSFSEFKLQANNFVLEHG